MKYTIYGIENLKTNKIIYVGLTTDFKNRLYTYDSHLRNNRKQKIIQKILEIGRKNIEFKILYTTFNDSLADKMEKYFIKFYNTIENGCNVYSGGRKGFTFKQTEETKEKIRKSTKGRIFTKEQKRKLSEAQKGRVFSKQHKLNISISKSNENNPLAKKIICLDDGKIFKTIKEAGLFYKISKNSICWVCKGKLKTAGKKKFKYYYPEKNDYKPCSKPEWYKEVE